MKGQKRVDTSDWYDWLLNKIESLENNVNTEERRARIVVISGSKAIGEKTILEDESLADGVKVKFDTRRMNQLTSLPNAENMSFKIKTLQVLA